MVANFVGDVLFAEDGALERFVDALSPDHKRTFEEFIRDFIDWIKSKFGKIDEVAMLERKYAKLFKDAVKSHPSESDIDNAVNVEYNDGTSYSYTSAKKSRKGWGNGADYLIKHFTGKINFDYADMYISDQELAIISHSIKTGWGALGESNHLGRVYTSEAYYVFSFDSNGSITILNVLDSRFDERIIDYIEEEIKNGRLRLGKTQNINQWINGFRNEDGQYRDGSGSYEQQTGGVRGVDELDGKSSTGNAGRDRGASNQNSEKDSINNDSTYSYTPKGENGVDNYTEEQYNNFGWVRANNVINAGYWRNFTENFAQAVSGNYNYPKNKNGEFMIDVYDAYDSSGITDVIVFASGTIESPNITKIVKIDLTNDIDIETKRRVLYEAERRGIQQTTGGVFRFYNKVDFISKFRHQRISDERNGNNNRLNTKRSRSEIKANRIVEFHIDEENGTVTTTYSNGEVVTESLSGQESSYSYTPTKSESFDELIKQYNEGLITEDEFKNRIVGRKSKDDPISVARMSEEAANTTPDIQRRQGKVKGDGEREFRDFCKNNKRFSVFQK